MDRNRIEELIEDLKTQRENEEKIKRLHQEKIDMLIFTISELEEALSMF